MSPRGPISGDVLSSGTLAQIACILEATAPKPGNVSPGHGFGETSWIDFLLGAAAIAPALARATTCTVGETVLDAVTASRAATGQNVNLGTVLLLAPLAAVPRGRDLRTGVRDVLDGLGPSDCDRVYRAIRLAAPGGIGEVSEGDVHGAPPSDLRAAMRLAADRDLVARQYTNGFADLFDFALPEFERALAAGLSLEHGIVRLHLRLMSTCPDSLIARKCGREVAREAACRAAAVLDRGWPRTEAALRALQELDAWLRADGHRRNPGTSADVVAATLFLALRLGIIQLPLSSPTAGSRQLDNSHSKETFRGR